MRGIYSITTRLQREDGSVALNFISKFSSAGNCRKAFSSGEIFADDFIVLLKL